MWMFLGTHCRDLFCGLVPLCICAATLRWISTLMGEFNWLYVHNINCMVFCCCVVTRHSVKKETSKRMAFLLLPSLLSSLFWRQDIKQVGKTVHHKEINSLGFWQWVPKVFYVWFGFALLPLVIGLKKTHVTLLSNKKYSTKLNQWILAVRVDTPIG